jgi:hypothetical protein
MHHVDVCHGLEHLERQVTDLALALRCIVDLARMDAGVGDQLRHVVDRQPGPRDDDGRISGEHADWFESARVEGEVAIEQMGDAVCPLRRTQQRVAIGGRSGHNLGPDIASTAGAVLDNENLSENPMQLVGDETRQSIGRPARRHVDDDRDGPARIIGLGRDCLLRRRQQHRKSTGQGRAADHGRRLHR